jgi:RHS repeat-associated protein
MSDHCCVEPSLGERRGLRVTAGLVFVRLRPLLVGVLGVLAVLGVLVATAVACEGGGPPSAPTTGESRIPEVNPGSPGVSTSGCGDPVNCASGDLGESQTDVSIGGRGPGLHVVRSYNALAAAEAKEAGAWGFGWTGPYSAHLEINSTLGTATVFQDNGSDVVFYKSGEVYTQGSWVEATLVKSGENYIYTLPDQSKLEFNSSGQLKAETDRNGNSISLTYNGKNQLEKATDGAKRSLTFEYNEEGLVKNVTDPMKHVVEYTYSSKNLASVTIEKKVRWEFEYNTSHLLTKMTDGRKHSTTNEFDTSHRAIKQERAGHKREWKYGTNETTLTEPNGSTTLEKFNEAGEPTEVIRAKGVSGVETTTKYVYNSAYQLTKLTDGNGHVTEYGYDAEDNRTSETDPNKDKREWTYDKTHDVETETTPEAEKTTIKRDKQGNPEVVERSINSETQKTEYKYNEKQDLTEAIDPLGHVTKFAYDGAGDKEAEMDPESNERKWKYNEDSQETEETSPRKFTTITERDEQGRPIKITDPLKHTTEYKYDGNGNVESVTDGNSHTTKYEYNEEDLRTKVEEPNKTIVETGYDSEGKMTSHTDGNKHTWEYKRNQLEQVTEEIDPLKHVTKKEYDAAGNLKKAEDPEAHTVEYKYDESNRLKSVFYSTKSPSEVTYEYNKDSKVTKMTQGTETTENTYDKLDRLTEAKNGAGKVVKYKYDLANDPTTITYPNGKEVTRAYDKDNRLEKVTDWNKGETKFSYNADSQPTVTTFPSGTEDKDEYAYNEADQMSEVEMLKGAKELGKLVYERDGDGQVKKTTTSVLPGPTSNEDKYDDNNRLIEDNKVAYEYDSANNPKKLEGSGTYTYNEADQLKEGPSATYTYNNDGRRTASKPKNGEPETTYTSDQAGNLTKVERAKGTKEPEIKDSYTYDGNNLRQSQTINGTKTNLTWDTAEPIPIIVEDETNNYIYGPENLPIEQINSTTTLYLHHDQQGSTRLLTNAKGETETAYTYNPYGTINATTGTTSTPLRYDGEYTSTDTGLIYLRARTYDPSTAQFLSIDPALLSTHEPYTYTKDNPLSGSDPGGSQDVVWRPVPPSPIDFPPPFYSPIFGPPIGAPLPFPEFGPPFFYPSPSQNVPSTDPFGLQPSCNLPQNLDPELQKSIHGSVLGLDLPRPRADRSWDIKPDLLDVPNYRSWPRRVWPRDSYPGLWLIFPLPGQGGLPPVLEGPPNGIPPHFLP